MSYRRARAVNTIEHERAEPFEAPEVRSRFAPQHRHEPAELDATRAESANLSGVQHAGGEKGLNTIGSLAVQELEVEAPPHIAWNALREGEVSELGP